jgi:phosphoglycolate phosphatase-like HAD superfamily hydrolase
MPRNRTGRNYKGVAAIKLAVFELDDDLDLDVGAYADDGTDRAALVPIAQKRATERYRHLFTRDNTVVIGDTSHDIAAAHKGGAAIVAVASGNDSADDLRKSGADTVLPDLSDTSAVVRHVMAAA